MPCAEIRHLVMASFFTQVINRVQQYTHQNTDYRDHNETAGHRIQLIVLYFLVLRGAIEVQSVHDLSPSRPAWTIQSLVRAHWLNFLGGTVSSLTVGTGIRHFVMAITSLG